MPGKRFFDWRNRLLASSRFRSWAQKIPFAQGVANRRARELFRLASGFVHSQVLLACVRLNLFETLMSGEQSATAIAERAGLPVERLRHLLRAAAALQLLERRGEDRFGLGVLGASMCENESLLALVEHHSLFYQDLSDPLGIYAASPPATRMSELWPYASSGQPDELLADDVGNYTRLMAASQTMVAEQVIGAFSFKGISRLMDIGGGAGVFAGSVARRWPDIRVTIADLPAVAELARASIESEALGERLSVIGVDAAEGPLPGDFEVISLVRILHDHDDEQAVRILRSARAALAPGGVLLIAEPMADAPGAGPLIDAYFQVYLLSMGSGRPRTLEELSSLLTAAGFAEIRLRKTRVPLITSVITASPG